MRWFINLVSFQIGWFSCAWGAAYGQPVWGIGVVAVLLVLHLAITPRPLVEGRLILLTGLIGTLIDSTLMHLHLLDFPTGRIHALVIPPWLIALWLLLATTLNGCLGWLQGRWWLCAGVGAVGGLVAYGAGGRLGAVEWTTPLWLTALVVSVVWAVLLPLLMALAMVLSGSASAKKDRAAS